MEGFKAAEYQLRKRQDGDSFGEEALFPVLPVTAQDAGDVVFVNRGRTLHNSGDRRSGFRRQDNLSLVRKGDLGIGDNKGRKQGMSLATGGTFHTADRERNRVKALLKLAQIITMDRKTSGMATGTGELVELKGGDEGVIGILRYGIAKINK